MSRASPAPSTSLCPPPSPSTDDHPSLRHCCSLASSDLSAASGLRCAALGHWLLSPRLCSGFIRVPFAAEWRPTVCVCRAHPLRPCGRRRTVGVFAVTSNAAMSAHARGGWRVSISLGRASRGQAAGSRGRHSAVWHCL